MWITKAQYEKDYQIRCTFEDGRVVLADFLPFLKNTKLQQLKRYLDMELFRKFRILDGSLSWEGNLLDIYCDDIYHGEFCA